MMTGTLIELKLDKNAWAFTYLPRFPNCTDLLPKSPFLLWIERHTNSLCDVLTSYRDLTWHHDHDDLWPTTLTYSLAKVMVNPHTKIKVIGQTVRLWECWHTDTHTDGKAAPILLSWPLTREVMTKKTSTSITLVVMDSHDVSDFLADDLSSSCHL